jgi:glutamate N-acetyltransferase/amino-acid N-acetyltransferase
VDYCRDRLREKTSARAILCNAGQANAATGEQGLIDAIASAQALSQVLGVPADSILLASTGVIGQRIKMDALKAALPKLVESLSETGSDSAAKAICTTDTVTKSIALEGQFGDRPVRIGGICKGAGMIHPNMATMLGFITCDAAVSPHFWQDMLSRAVNKSFNQITVDGDTSTNDTVLALANGESRTPAITEPGPEADQLEAMLTAVCIHLAKAIARDGEGATCLIEVQVSGASDAAAARQIARTIAGSSLVKSAIFGRDPNWGRIAGAAGRAGVPFNQEDLQIKLGDFLMMEHGQPQLFDRAAANAYLKKAAEGAYLKDDTVLISVKVGSGPGTGTAWGCDLSYDYVKINAEYTT